MRIIAMSLVLALLAMCSSAPVPAGSPFVDTTHDDGNAVLSGIVIYASGVIELKRLGGNLRRSLPKSDRRLARLRRLFDEAAANGELAAAVRATHTLGSGERIRVQLADAVFVARPWRMSPLIRDAISTIDDIGKAVFGRRYRRVLDAQATTGGASREERTTGVVLPQSQAAKLLAQCGRATPKIEGTWQPASSVLAQLERDLPGVLRLRSSHCCLIGARVDSLDGYYRQYVGVRVEGRDMVYINAFPVQAFKDWPSQFPVQPWHVEPYVACDGGRKFWGVLYDPGTRTFAQLAFNGVA